MYTINTKGDISMKIQKTGNLKAEQRLQIREGMSVEDVKKYGSKGQQIAASLFDSDLVENAKGDYVKDGVFTKQEAEHFNNYNFSVKNNVFTMYDRKHNQTTEIKYDNIEDLYTLLNNKNNETGSLWFSRNGKIQLFIGESTEGGKITLDLSKGNITANGVNGEYIIASGNKVTVKNSDIERVSVNAKELEIQNTKDKGIMWDSPTEVEAGKNTTVKIDTTSDVTLKRDDE